jgi:bis(5'-nucleosyl)-tetraphosphatase (symmetrical)
MAIYAIGDVQGCYDELRRLLDKVNFDPVNDRLWLTGDLVNRGPRSAEVLRFVIALGDRAVTVLGNHDLHLLAAAAGAVSPSPGDTLASILEESDSEQLLTWLAHRPLMHRDMQVGYTLVHAGLVPQWDIELAEHCAREAEAVLTGVESEDFLRHMYGDKPDRWDPQLSGWDRVRLIVNVFTRARFCYPDGRLDYRHKGVPGSQPSPLLPWFQVPGRRSIGERVIFGHWSLLGLWDRDGVIGLDTGCLWGRRLTCVRLTGERAFTSIDCPVYQG